MIIGDAPRGEHEIKRLTWERIADIECFELAEKQM